MNLFINLYNDKNKDRQVELEECFLRNCINKEIKLIYCIVDFEFDNRSFIENKKVVYVKSNTRPTYNDYFKLINIYSHENKVSCISNSDIYFDETGVRLIKTNINHGECYALSRWDVLNDKTVKHFCRPDTADVWVFKGKIKEIYNCSFKLGVPGCDNAIANRLEISGYRVLNPSKDIRTYHLHNSGIRNYLPKDKVPPPYKLIHPHGLQTTSHRTIR